MRFSLPFSRARCSAFSCAACAAAFRSFSYALCTAAYPNNYKLLSPLVIRRFPAGENTCTMTFLMRFALPFSQMRCGAFSCAACAATFGSFSYAVCAAAYPSNYKRLSPLAIRRFSVGENTCIMTFLMRLFFRALRCHLRQFFLCGFSFAVCAAIFVSAVWRLFLCCLRRHIRQFFLCGFSFALCAAICVSAVCRSFNRAVFSYTLCAAPAQTTINFFPHSPSAAFLLAKIPAP